MDEIHGDLERENQQLRQENRWLRQHYERLRRQELVSHLVHGRFLDVDSILADLRRHGIHLDRDSYVLMRVRVLTDPSAMNEEAAGEDIMYYERHVLPLEPFIESFWRRDYECSAVHMDSGALCLVGLDALPGRGQVSAVLDPLRQGSERLCAQILDRFGVQVYVSLSRPSDGVEGIPAVYPELERAAAPIPAGSLSPAPARPLKAPPEEPHQPKWYPELLQFLRDHYQDPNVNVSSISDRFLLTPSHLSREVKRMSGWSLFDYIQRLRLECAVARLSAGLSAQEAAEQSGFGDARSMRRAFQKILHTTPREFVGSLPDSR